MALNYASRISAPTIGDQIDEYHDRIVAIITWARRLLDRRQPPDAVVREITAKRLEMSRLMMEYALLKHRDVFAPAIAAGGEKAREGMRLKLACIAAAETYRDYVRRPRLRAPDDDWERYRVEAAAMAVAIRDHLAEERAAIRRLLGLRGRRAAKPGVT